MFYSKFKKGMTLAELVMAIGLIAICVGGIIGVTLQGLDLEQSINYNNTALNIAKSRIEQIRHIRDDKGIAAVAMTGEADKLVNNNGVSDDAGNFKRSTVIDSATYTPLVEVTVTVRYKKRGLFNPEPITLISFVSEYYK